MTQAHSSPGPTWQSLPMQPAEAGPEKMPGRHFSGEMLGFSVLKNIMKLPLCPISAVMHEMQTAYGNIYIPLLAV